MRIFDRNGLATRAFAVFFTAFCVVASARALIPGLCGTLSGLNRDEAALCRSPEHVCCQSAPAEGAAVTVSAPDSHCGFCAIVHAVAHSVSVPEVSPAPFTSPAYAAAHDFYVPNATGTDAYPRRGPPNA
jgi:hypothetical protein